MGDRDVATWTITTVSLCLHWLPFQCVPEGQSWIRAMGCTGRRSCVQWVSVNAGARSQTWVLNIGARKWHMRHLFNCWAKHLSPKLLWGHQKGIWGFKKEALPVLADAPQSMESGWVSNLSSIVALMESDIMSQSIARAQFLTRPGLKQEELDIFGHKSNEEWILQLPIHTIVKCHGKHSNLEGPKGEAQGRERSWNKPGQVFVAM